MDMRIESFSKKNILVIGDIMIDQYLYGDVERISPEAPVPIVRVKQEENVLGGAANVANNIISLGGNCTLLSVCGDDTNAEVLQKKLQEKKIDHVLVKDIKRPTTIKKRIISGNNHQLIRLDYEETHYIGEDIEKILLDSIKDFDAIVISDYAKGCITESLAKKLIHIAGKKPVIVDTKPMHKSFYRGCYLMTPNLKEAIDMTGLSAESEIGSSISKSNNCNVYITLGARGIHVFTKEKELTVPSAKVTKIYDVTGAGDTVVAASALAVISGMDLFESARIANAAAGVVVQKPGTSTATVEEINRLLEE
jgi:D-glycero-beta-D-manno-heptose-7-phosphate kinase